MAQSTMEPASLVKGRRTGELYNQVAVFKSEHFIRADSDDWDTEEELEADFMQAHQSVQRALTRVKRDRR